MSYNSKRTVVSMAMGILAGFAYMIYALGGSAPAPEDVRGWAIAMLVFIGISVAAVIVVQILFHIALGISVTLHEKDEKSVKRVLKSTMMEDEWDKAVGRKSSVFGYSLSGLGFCAALIALAAGGSVVLALHILFGASFLGGLTEGGMSVYFYEQGLQDGE